MADQVFFPIQVGLPGDCRGFIPWAMIAPHEPQALHNHGQQSLATLARRGGLSPSEAVAVLLNAPLPHRERLHNRDLAELMVLVAEYAVNGLAELQAENINLRARAELTGE